MKGRIASGMRKHPCTFRTIHNLPSTTDDPRGHRSDSRTRRGAGTARCAGRNPACRPVGTATLAGARDPGGRQRLSRPHRRGGARRRGHGDRRAPSWLRRRLPRGARRTAKCAARDRGLHGRRRQRRSVPARRAARADRLGPRRPRDRLAHDRSARAGLAHPAPALRQPPGRGAARGAVRVERHRSRPVPRRALGGSRVAPDARPRLRLDGRDAGARGTRGISRGRGPGPLPAPGGALEDLGHGAGCAGCGMEDPVHDRAGAARGVTVWQSYMRSRQAEEIARALARRPDIHWICEASLTAPWRPSMIRWLALVLALGLAAAPAAADSPPVHLFDIHAGTDRASQMAQAADGRIYVTDAYNHRVLQFNELGQLLSQFGSYGVGPGQFSVPSGVAFDPEGNVYIADQFNHRIQKLTSSHMPVMTFGSFGTGPGQLWYPTNLGVSPVGSVLYVTEYYGNRVSMFDTNGGFLGSFGSEGAGPGQFDRPWGLAVETTGEIIIVDEYNHRVQRFTAGGLYVGQFGFFGIAPGQFNIPTSPAFDQLGDLYVCDELNHRIQKFDRYGTFRTQWNGSGAPGGGFYNPWSVLVTAAGNIWVSDTGNGRIQVYGFLPTPAVRPSWGSVKSTYRR